MTELPPMQGVKNRKFQMYSTIETNSNISQKRVQKIISCLFFFLPVEYSLLFLSAVCGMLSTVYADANFFAILGFSLQD